MSERKALVVKHIVVPGFEQARTVVCTDDKPTIQKLIDQAKWSFKLPTICIVNGVPLLRPEWNTRIVGPEDEVCFLSRPWGGGGNVGGVSKTKAILGIVALIAIAAFAAWAGPALAAGLGLTGSMLTIGGQMITAGIVLGGSLLISTLIYPKAGSGNNQPVDQLFSLSAAGNVARPLATIPVQYGKLKTYPDYAITPYSDYLYEYQYLNLVLSLGPGKFHIHKIFIDNIVIASETPQADFGSGIGPAGYPPAGTVPFSPGALFPSNQINPAFYGRGGVPWTAPGFGTPTLGPWIAYYNPGDAITLLPINIQQAPTVSGQVLGDPAGLNPWLGGFIANDAGTKLTGVWIDIAFPGGLYLINSSGGLFNAQVSIEIQAQAINDSGAPIGPWGDIGVPTFRQATHQPWRQSLYFALGPGRYQIRMARTSTPANLLQQPDSGGNTTVDDVIWLGLRAQLIGSNSFPDVSTLAMRILATNQLSQQSSVHIGVLATRIIPVWNGSQMVEMPSQSPAWAFFDAATNTQYGASRPVSKVDFQGIIDLDASAAARGDTCNILFTSAVPVPQAFDSILMTTRSKHRWTGDVLTYTRDEAKAVPQMLLTDRQIVRDSLNIAYIFNDEVSTDSVILEYLDESTWLPAEVQYPPNGSVQGFVSTLPARIRADGITNREQAKREAAFFYLQSFYRRVKVTLDTEHDGRLLNLGSVIRVQSELPQTWGSSGSVEALTFDGVNHYLEVEPAPDWSAAGTHYVNVRSRTGGSFGPIACSQGGTPDILILNNADLATVTVQQNMTIDQVCARRGAADEPSYDFGVGTAVSRTCIVLAGAPRGDGVTLTLVVDNPLVHSTSLSAVPPLPPASPLLNPDVPVISGLIANFRQGVLEPILDATWWPAKGAFYYDAQVSYDGGNSWLEIYSGTNPSFSKVVQLSGLRLRVAGISKIHGAWVELDVTPPTIVLQNPVVGVNALVAGLSNFVTTEFKRTTDRINNIAQLIATGAAEQDAANWLDKHESKNAVSSSFNNLSATVSVVSSTVVTNQLAFASYQVTTAVTLGSLSASVTTNSSAVATIQGKLAAQYTVTLDVNGYVTGLKAYNDGTTSAFIIITDDFQVAKPGISGGAPIPVFQIDTVSGVAKVAIRGDMMADGTIVARNMAVGSINASNIIAGNIIVTGHLVADAATSTAYTQASNFVFPNSLARTTIVSMSFTVAVGPVDIIMNYEVNSSTFQSATALSFTSTLLIDGVATRTWNSYSGFAVATSPPTWAFASIVTLANLSSLSVGTHTIALAITSTAIGPNAVLFLAGTTFIAPSIRVLESRR